MKRSLGPQESLFFALMQMRGQRTVRTGELIGPMGITSQQEEELLRRLARGRLIARVRRGLYLIPSRLPVGGSWSPDEVLALNTLIEDRGGAIKSVARTRSIVTDSTIKFQPEFTPTTIASLEIGPSAPYR
jgi:hypothetical protein